MSGVPQRTDRPPIRIAHLGLGAFHRAHQAWYTQRANAGADTSWGIAAFTGRRPDAATRLAAQDGVYTLIERSAAGDRVERVESVVAAHPGDDPAWLDTLASPDVGVLTVTVTEAGYRASAAPAVRIAEGLEHRRTRGGGAIAVISCDNLLGNGATLRNTVAATGRVSTDWLDRDVSFVDTVVDRITPATTDADRVVAAQLAGWHDAVPVVTEPFHEWVLAGDLPAGHPGWDAAGALFVADARPYEERKLWLLNAAHTFLAAGGLLGGHETVDQAFADAELRERTEALWSEQRQLIDLPADDVDAWLAALRERFDNPRIAHRLDQIARDSALKIGPRVLVPIAVRGGAGPAQRDAVATWARSITELTPTDEHARDIAADLRALSTGQRVTTVIDRLTPKGRTS